MPLFKYFWNPLLDNAKLNTLSRRKISWNSVGFIYDSDEVRDCFHINFIFPLMKNVENDPSPEN